MTSLRWARIVIADPGLIDSIGHHLGYSYSVAAAAIARGTPAVILAGRSFPSAEVTGPIPCRPVFESLYQTAARQSAFRRLVYSASSHLPGNAGRAIAEGLRSARRMIQRVTLVADRLGEELGVELQRMPDACRALVLLHSVSSANLASLPAAIAPDAIGGLAVVLRRTPLEMDTTDAAPQPVGTVVRALRRHFGTRLHLFADTEELAQLYRDLLDDDIVVVPIPVVTPPVRPPYDGGLPHLVFAGGARAEKGYMLLPRLIQRLRGRARFTIHSGAITGDSDPLVQAAHRSLLALADQDVVILERSLSPDDYLALIGQADLLLLPYDAVAYGPRSSGILAEARAMGVPATVPAGTWMESARGPSDAVVFTCADDFPLAVERALADLPNLTRQYHAAAESWRRLHNPDALYAMLTGETVPVPV